MLPKGNKNEFEIHEDFAYMLINRKGEIVKTKIDLDEVQRIKRFDYTFGAVKKTNGLYTVTSAYDKGKYKDRIYFHRWVLEYDGVDYVDHINGDTLDNRKSNLRIVKPYQNSQNRKAASNNNSSGVRGVYREKGKWRARIMIRGKRKNLGFFDTVEEASKTIEDELIKFWDAFE